MVDAREPDVFEMKVLDAIDGCGTIQIAAFVRFQQFLELIQIHLCPDILTFDSTRSVPYHWLSRVDAYQKHPADPRDDQNRAHAFCVAVCFSRGGAGREWCSDGAADLLDRGGDGRRT